MFFHLFGTYAFEKRKHSSVTNTCHFKLNYNRMWCSSMSLWRSFPVLIQKSGYVLPLAFDANGRILCSILSFILLCVSSFFKRRKCTCVSLYYAAYSEYAGSCISCLVIMRMFLCEFFCGWDDVTYSIMFSIVEAFIYLICCCCTVKWRFGVYRFAAGWVLNLILQW